MINKIRQEPVIAWFAGHVAVNGGQIAISGIPTWLHIVILALTTIASATGARQQVTPVK